VSIGLPVYNGERYLAEALDSILAQDFGDFELIISDNASTDTTRNICEAYARRDPRVTYSRLPENLGAAPNYNRVFRMANGGLFKWAAHDDRLHPAFLTRCIDALDSFASMPSVVYPKAEVINEDGVIIGQDTARMHASSEHRCVRGFQVVQGMGAVYLAVSGVFQRAALERTRLIGSYVASDRVLLLEAALLGKVIQLEGEPLFQRRVHPGMSTKANVSHQDRLRWFDPQARSTSSRNTKIHLEYLRSPVRMSELSWMSKIACLVSIASGVLVRNVRVPLGRYRRRFISVCFQRNSGA
jgi:glycosyltransferase involved in cell wall biosynthesis